MGKEDHAKTTLGESFDFCVKQRCVCVCVCVCVGGGGGGAAMLRGNKLYFCSFFMIQYLPDNKKNDICS